jgi:ribonuclease VapC
VILDTSAVVAVARRERGYQPIADALNAAPELEIGAPTLFEAAMVLQGRAGKRGLEVLSSLLAENGVVTAPFDKQHSKLALEAFARYGKGRHPAGLNYGDCMTYATARVTGRPLLCVGGDFAKTDLPLALA